MGRWRSSCLDLYESQLHINIQFTIYNNASNPTLVSGDLSFNTTSKKWFNNIDVSNLPSGNYNVVVTFADSDVGNTSSPLLYLTIKQSFLLMFNHNTTPTNLNGFPFSSN